jgi:hypothetical protein
LDRSSIDLCDRRLIDPGGIMEHPDQGSPLPADPAGREDIMSDEQAGRQETSRDEPRSRVARAAAENSPLSPDPARREDVIRDDVLREDDFRDAEQPGDAAAGG